jgi:hypothetical protein
MMGPMPSSILAVRRASRSDRRSVRISFHVSRRVVVAASSRSSAMRTSIRAAVTAGSFRPPLSIDGAPGAAGSADRSARRRAPLLVSSSIQFRWLIILALGSRRSVEACPQSREACVRLGLQISEHLPIRGFDFSENFIDLCKHFQNERNHFTDLTPQLLYVPARTFVEIAHAAPSYPTSSWNCSNSPRKFNGGPLVPSLMIGVTV